jgi:RNase P/RNase MRP subunit POP5
MRLKFRYLIYQLLSDGGDSKNDNISQRDVLFAVKDKVQALFGDVGAGLFGQGALIKLYDDYSRVFVLRVPREQEMEMRVAICSISQLRNSLVVVRLLAVCGCGRTALDKLKVVFQQVALNAPTPAETQSLNLAYSDMLTKSTL